MQAMETSKTAVAMVTSKMEVEAMAYDSEVAAEKPIAAETHGKLKDLLSGKFHSDFDNATSRINRVRFVLPFYEKTEQFVRHRSGWEVEVIDLSDRDPKEKVAADAQIQFAFSHRKDNFIKGDAFEIDQSGSVIAGYQFSSHHQDVPESLTVMEHGAAVELIEKILKHQMLLVLTDIQSKSKAKNS